MRPKKKEEGKVRFSEQEERHISARDQAFRLEWFTVEEEEKEEDEKWIGHFT